MAEDDPKRVADTPGAAVTRTEIPAGARERQLAVSSRGFAYSTDPASPMIQDLPTIEDDAYEIGDEVARGGLGRILSARDMRLNRTVAIKQLALPHPAARARFAREVLITAQLSHPNIIALHEAGRWRDGTPFYSMELIEGRSLADALSATESFDERLALLGHVTAVAEAMAYAHSQRIIHRDLKPANVLVGAFGETVVIDWGLAKQLDAGPAAELSNGDPAPEPGKVSSGFDTSDGAVLGTPAYMPPEQATGDLVDERADVYALGAMLYQLLAAVRPYADTPPDRLLARIIEGPPTPVAELVSHAPRDLCAIVDKAMARDPERRYRTAGEMAEELRRFATGRMVGAYDYTTWEHLARFARRARGVLVTATVALVVLAVLGAMAVRRIQDERDRAEDNAEVAEQSRAAAEDARARTEESMRDLRLEQARSLLGTDPTRAAELVRGMSPRPPGADSIAAEADERGVALRVLEGAGDRVRAVAIAGDTIVTGGDDGMHVWTGNDDAATQPRGHTDRVASLALARDGKRLASGSYDRTVRVWNTADWDSVELRGHRDKIKRVAWVDDQHIASIDAAGGLWLWRPADHRGIELRERGPTDAPMSAVAGLIASAGGGRGEIEIYTTEPMPPRVLVGHGAPISALAVCSAGRWMYSADAAGEVWRWDLTIDSGRPIGRVGRAVTAIDCSADGDAMAAADAAGAVVAWRKGGELRRIGAHDGPVTALIVSTDGERVLSASNDKSARIWRQRTGDYRELLGHGDAVAAIAVAGARLVTGSFDKTARVWKVEDPSHLTLGRHSGGVRSVALSPDGTRVASAGRDGAVGMWPAAGGPGQLWRGHRDIVYRVLFSPDGRWVASSSDDKTVILWDAATGERRELHGHTGDVEELAFSPDSTLLASASRDDTAWLWETASGRGRRLLRHGGDVTSVTFSPDGTRVVTTGADRLVRVYDLSRDVEAELRGHENEVWSAAFDGPGAIVSVASEDFARRWDLATNAWTKRWRRFEAARLVRIAGDVVAIAGRGRTIFVCPRTGDGDCRELVGHTGPVEDIALSPDGAVLVSAGADHTVRLWDVASGEHRTYRGHTGTVFDVELSDDAIYSASADGRVMRWKRKPVR